MNCLEAQQIVSAALDREVVDPVALHEAKAHCRTCGECEAFVRTLASMHRATGPQPPDDLADRAMKRVHEYIAADKAKSERAELAALKAAQNTGAAPAPSAASAAARRRTWSERWRDPRERRQLLAWASAAAVLVLGVGYAAGLGVRQILAPPDVVMERTSSTDQLSAASGPAGEQMSLSATGQPSAAAPSGQAAPAATAPVYVVVDENVFRLSGPASADPNQLRAVGKTTSLVREADVAGERDVLAGVDVSRVYVADDTGALHAFDRVVRTYDGRSYQLRSANLSGYGQWPVFPSEMTAPTTDDGSPNMVPLELDASGASLYRLSSSSAVDGVAVGPGSQTTDPAAGNPNWTWWTPIR